MNLYIFRTVPMSIIRSFSPYTQQWYMSYRFADSCRAAAVYCKYTTAAVYLQYTRTFTTFIVAHVIWLHNSHCNFYVYGSVHRWFISITVQRDAPISQNYFWNKTLQVSDSSYVHHQESNTVHTAKLVWPIHIAVCTVLDSWWWIEKLSETCRVLIQK